MKKIADILFDNQDIKYRNFNSKLIPNIDKDRFIGVRVPVLRKIAKDIVDYDYIDDFLEELPHKYHEENILHGILLTVKYNDIDIILDKLDKFLIYADNWAITDVISPKIFKKYPDKVYTKIMEWLKSEYFYVNMAIAWFWSFALIKKYDDTIIYFKEKRLDKWIHNKSIQKACDSYRISLDKKEYLRSIKI